MALSSEDKQWISRMVYDTVTASLPTIRQLNFEDGSELRDAVRQDQETALKGFASELSKLLMPIYESQARIHEQLENLLQGVSDAAGEIRNREASDPDSWWRGNPEDE